MFFKKNKSFSESELIQECLNGNEGCFKLLYEKHYGVMLNICKRYAADSDEAKDIVQEGFIRVFKNLHKYSFRGSFEGWMKRIMVTTSINFFNERKKHQLIEYQEQDNLVTLEENIAIIPNDAKIDPEFLLKAVQQLPEVYKMVFNLNVMEGYAHKEIAETLNITESTSRSNLAKAKRKVREMVLKSLKKTA